MVERAEIRECLATVVKELRHVAMDVTAERSDKVLVTGLEGVLELLSNLVNDIHADANPDIAESAEAVKLSNLPKAVKAFQV